MLSCHTKESLWQLEIKCMHLFDFSPLCNAFWDVLQCTGSMFGDWLGPAGCSGNWVLTDGGSDWSGATTQPSSSSRPPPWWWRGPTSSLPTATQGLIIKFYFCLHLWSAFFVVQSFLPHLWSFLCWFFKEGIWCWRWEGGWEGAATGCWFAIPTLSHALKIPTLSHALKIPTLSHALKTHSGEKSNSPHSHSHSVTCWSSTFSHHTVWYGMVGRVEGAHPSPAAFYHIAAGAGPGLRGHGDDPTHPPTPPPSLPTGGKCGGRGLGSGLDMHRQRCF